VIDGWPALTAMSTTLRVNSIQRFCLHDGPGICTTVFLQGCPLRCWWCQNPQTIPLRSDEMREWEIGELADVVERDARFWRPSGGGVTLSGGEPLIQPDGAAGFLELMGRRGHHRCVETAGHVGLPAVQRVAPHVDLWLWDVKSTDPQRFREGTGGEARRPMENLLWVLQHTATDVRVRIPVIAGFNDDEGSAGQLAAFLADLPRRVMVELLPGHDIRRSGPPPTRSAKVDPGRVAVLDRRLREAGCVLYGR